MPELKAPSGLSRTHSGKKASPTVIPSPTTSTPLRGSQTSVASSTMAPPMAHITPRWVTSRLKNQEKEIQVGSSSISHRPRVSRKVMPWRLLRLGK